MIIYESSDVSWIQAAMDNSLAPRDGASWKRFDAIQRGYWSPLLAKSNWKKGPESFKSKRLERKWKYGSDRIQRRYDGSK